MGIVTLEIGLLLFLFFAIVREIFLLPSFSELATPEAPLASKEKVPLRSKMTVQSHGLKTLRFLLLKGDRGCRTE